MQTPTPSNGPRRPPRNPAAGIGRPGGLLTAALTAAIVFAVGKQLLPPPAPPAPPRAPLPQPAPVAPTPPAPSPDARGAATAGGDAMVAASTDGSAAIGDVKAAAPEADAAGSRDGRAALGKPAAEPGRAAGAEAQAEPSTEPPGTEATGAPSEADRKAADAASQADKDLARDAWHRNKPEITASGSKASILIPLKGRTAGSSYKYFKKTHAIVVTLPKAAALITMKFYKLHRDGFSALWIYQEEVNAKASDGTRLRLVLTAHAPPIVEIRDDFVKVTIARPTAVRSTRSVDQFELMEPGKH